MKLAELRFAFAFALALVMCPPSHASAQTSDGATHRRLETTHGPVHIFQPGGYNRAQSGVVIYVHGYYNDVDEAYREHNLDEQLQSSGRSALLIVPEAPSSGNDEVVWPSLGDLLRVVSAEIGPLPDGPLVVVGHSAAYRTIAGWLDYGPLEDVILLDALYGNEEDFASWLTEARGHERHRLTLVTNDTAKNAEPFVRRFPTAVSLPRVPGRWGAEADAQLVELRAQPQYGHMEIVTSGRVLPLALQRTRLRALPER